MRNLFTTKGMAVYCAIFVLVFISYLSFAQGGQSTGRIFQKVNSFKQKQSFSKEYNVFEESSRSAYTDLTKLVKKFKLLDIHSVDEIVKSKPDFLNFTVPSPDNGIPARVLLYKESISSNGFTLISSDGNTSNAGDIVHYKGAVDGQSNSVAAFSFSNSEIAGFISNADGNFVIGKLQDNSGEHIIYNDKDLTKNNIQSCGTNTDIPLSPGNYYKAAANTANLTTKCVNWYWETDQDIFTAKGSLANVNTFMQAIFNQVQTLYANDGISITLKTLFVWTTTDPYTGTNTNGYLDQFGVYRTTFDGDLATLIGTKGGGGVAWINGLCNGQTKYKMAYCGIYTSYSSVPTYSWTVEVITHEQGHQLGSRHTHDCVWNGNNTKIDGCGDNAGYTSGTCAVPANPVGGGTIMSYCHLTGVGINFNLGFGPQPTALIINNVNNSVCLTNCNSGCTVPDQPTTIAGNTAVCAATSQTYSVAPVSGATSYTWTLPSGFTGSSVTNSITLTTGTNNGSISVLAVNSCGNSTASTLAIVTTAVPLQPAIITGNTAVCPGTAQTYAVTAVNGISSYTWTLPSGWSGNSTTNSINVTSGTGGGNIKVTANNTCGISIERSLTISITAAAPAQPGNISGPSIVCPGTVQTFSIATVAGASSYNWTLPTGWSGTSTSNSIIVSAGSQAGNISVTAVNGCGTGAARSLAVTAGGTTPSTPGVITVTGGAATVCTGDSRTYTVPQVSATTYNWVTPAGTTINSGQGTNSIDLSFTANFTSPGTLSVTPSNNCGAGAARTLSISKAVLSKPGTITVAGGIVKVCSGDTRSYSVTAVAGVTYNWVAPVGASISSGQGTAAISITFTPNFTANGTLSVTANSACGSSAARTLTIARNLPTSPASISGNLAPCAGTIASYTVPVVSGATSYLWTLPAGAVAQGSSTGNSINILWGTRGGTLAAKTVNNCGTSGSRSVKVVISCTARPEAFVNSTDSKADVYPNPANDIANVRFFAKEKELFNLSVTDITGRKLITDRLQSTAGINQHSFNVSRLAKGTYLIIIESIYNRQILKLNVQ